MYTTFLTVALFATAAIQGVAADIAVGTPTIVNGQDLKLTWQKTQGPYNVAIVPADDPCNKILVDVGDVDATYTVVKNVQLTPGQKVLVSILDSTDQEGWSNEITVQDPSQSSSAAPSASVSDAASSTPIPTVTLSDSSSAAAPSSSASVVAVGAAGGGIMNQGSSANGALSVAAASLPVVALAAFGAILVL